MRTWVTALLVALAVPYGAACAQVPDSYRAGKSYYEEFARDVARLGIIPEDGREVACENNVYAANPCPEIVQAWYEFTELHDLPRSAHSAAMLQAYIERDYRTADRMYAGIKGYTLPEDARSGPSGARTVAGLGVERELGGDVSCNNDVMSGKPCPEAVRAFKKFAAEHGLTLNSQSAAMFQNYVEGRTREADRMFARSVGGGDAEPRNDILASAQSYGVERKAGMEVGECVNNYYASNPCLEAVRAWKDFAREHELELNRQSADIFESYVENNPERGDRLFASAKGMSVAELLEKRGHPAVAPAGQPLYVPVYPAGDGR